MTSTKTKGRAPALALRLVGRLGWESGYDENDNTTLEACAGEGPGGDSSGEIYYRLRQEVQNNMHVWVEASSAALRMDPEGPLRWHKKHEARRAIQRHHDSLLSANAEMTDAKRSV